LRCWSQLVGTVVYAFEQLRVEGYIESIVGSGSYVARNLPDEFFRTGITTAGLTGVTRVMRSALSKQVRKILASRLLPTPPRQKGNAFRAYEPAVDAFPTALGGRLSGRRMRQASVRALAEGDVRGYKPLRTAVAAYLGAFRGVRCVEDQIFVVSGTQHALDLISRTTIDPGDTVWMENPGYGGASCVLEAAQARVRPLPVDCCGLVLPSKGLQRARPKLVYLTPAHQFPTGVIMSLERRLEWLAYAGRSGCMIFEDDYDGEYRFRGKPLPTLQGLDKAGSVIYACSFSKLLFPTLRLGILIVPQNLVDGVVALRTIADRYAPYLEQAVLCDFFTEGHFGHHIRCMRELYAERLSVLLESSRQYLSGLLDVQTTEAGLQTLGWLCDGIFDVAASQAAARRGVEVIPVSYFASTPLVKQGLVLGFASAKPGALRSGVERLASALAELA